MQIKQTNRFMKAYKKLHSSQLVEVNRAIDEVIQNPYIGKQKKGSLSWLRVHKFKVFGHLTLLGYSFDKSGLTTSFASGQAVLDEAGEMTLTFVDLGPHENFYKDLQ